MKPGYWDLDGFHEGPMPATDFTPRRAPIADRKPESADNLGQPAQGFPRGGQGADLTPSPGNRHSSESEVAWVDRELGDVPSIREELTYQGVRVGYDLTMPASPQPDAATVGDCA